MPHPDRIIPAHASLVGPDGRPLIRDRRAPPPSRHAALEGWVRWGLIDRSGREVQAGEQHNLILDTFLDGIATNTQTGGFLTGSIDSALGLEVFLSHFAVGTGSTEPDVTDTALDSELVRTTTETAKSVTRTGNGVYDLMIEREFDFDDANGNLTEFGFAGGATADMRVRELFRDAEGDPVTISKTSDYKLRIKYTLTVTLTPVIATAASFTIDGIGLLTGTEMWRGGSGTSQAFDAFVFSRLARGAVVTSRTSGRNAFPVLSQDDDGTAYADEVGGASNNTFDATSVAVSTYTPGSYTRSIESATWGTTAGNVANIRHIGVGKTAPSANYSAGFSFRAQDADRFTKDNLHQLVINDLLTVSWGRA